MGQNLEVLEVLAVGEVDLDPALANADDAALANCVARGNASAEYGEADSE